MPLDDRFMDGVWYEIETGDFVTFDRDGDDVHICDEEGDVLDTVEFVDFTPSNYYRVPEDAVDDPVSVLKGGIRRLTRNDVNELTSTSHRESIGLRYAARHTDVVEADD